MNKISNYRFKMFPTCSLQKVKSALKKRFDNLLVIVLFAKSGCKKSQSNLWCFFGSGGGAASRAQFTENYRIIARREWACGGPGLNGGGGGQVRGGARLTAATQQQVRCVCVSARALIGRRFQHFPVREKRPRRLSRCPLHATCSLL